MPIPVEPNALAATHGGQTGYRDDPAELLAGWPGTQAVLQSRKVNFTVTNLGTTTKVYVGGTKADIAALAAFYADLGATIDIEEGATIKLTVNLPYDEFSNLDADPLKYALWEVSPQAASRDIFDVGIFAPPAQRRPISQTRATVNNVQKGAIEQAVRNPMMTVNLAVKSEWADKQFLAENFLALKRLKADSVQAFTQTLRRTLILNNKNSLQYDPVSENNPNIVNPIISAGDLVSLYSIPPIIQVHMMPSYVRPRYVTGQDSVQFGGLAGYLVKRPTYQQVSPLRIQMTQEFVWDEWLDALYLPYGGDYSKFPLYS